MKKPKAATEKPAQKVKAEQPVAATAPKTTAKKPSPDQKTAKKAQAAAPKPVAVQLVMPERVGLTAGRIWHYLAENGATPVEKLVGELTEEEKIIQRSIGWLAQEGKITLAAVDRVETIALKD